MSDKGLYDKKLYINRELSWLEFNRRCLCEAENPDNPLLERLKFLAICYSNLDEFYMIRIPGLLRQESTGIQVDAPDYCSKNELMSSIFDTVSGLFKSYEVCWRKLKKLLVKSDINIKTVDQLSETQLQWIRNFYRTRVHPVLTPLALDVSHPFPFISNNSLNLAFKLKKERSFLYARVKVPINLFDRFVELPSENGDDFILIEDIIKDSAHLLFPGFKISGVYAFRVTRNADIKVTIDEACDLMSAVEESVGERDTGFPVAMMVDASMPKNMISIFGRNLKIGPRQIIATKEALDLSSLWQLTGLNRPKLKEKPLVPYIPPEFSEENNIFDRIKKKDWIFFHPYESFGIVIRFINDAANDPNVQSIKICLYRIGKDPSIYEALKSAREKGKTVSVLMELRAKFDENRNIQWAKELEAIGVHVVYGPVDLKVHSKLLQVVRLEGDSLVRYTHMSSGNYNVSTARQYGDISFFTANQEIGEDVGELFNTLTGFFGPRQYKHLLVAPLTLKSKLIEKIDREIENQKLFGNGHIMMKANGLIDADIISSLYRASMAGVRVDLNIRGLCCLRPGVEGVSDNIRVISIVDRFLEHSRIYYFHNNGVTEMYMGSSDMMPRNLVARVEVLFPVLDPNMKELILQNILKIHFADNVKAKMLLPDGSYVPVPKNGKKSFRSQQWFIENRGIWHG